MKSHVWYLGVFFLVLPVGGIAQQASVISTIDRDTLKIGEQATLIISANNLSNETVTFPELYDTITQNLEIVEKSDIDSISSEAGSTYKQFYVITSFDSGTYNIPAFPVLIRTKNAVDTLYTVPSTIYISNIPVDTSKAAKDIKEIREIPDPDTTNYRWLWWLLLLIPIATAIYYYLKNRKPKSVKAAPPIPKKPAHEQAMKELNLLESQKLWQKGRQKEYHSRLTGIVRTYLEGRYNIPALEQTTGVVLSTLKNSSLAPKGEQEKLAQLMRLADMVKFARYNPVAHENELSLNNAKEFIQNTVPAALQNDKD